MNSSVQTARWSGLLWLLSLVTGGFSLQYLRSSVIVAGDATATAANIVAAESWFRAAIVSGLFSQLFFFFLGLTLFRWFRSIDKELATVLFASVLIAVAIAVVNALHLFAALHVLSGADYLKVFNPDQLNAMAMLFVRLVNSAGQGLLEIFWVPYYVSFGLLIVRSNVIPKIFGILLMAMGIAFALNVFTKFLIPQFHPEMFSQLAMSLFALGGIPTILWLLVKGARDPASNDHRAIQN